MASSTAAQMLQTTYQRPCAQSLKVARIRNTATHSSPNDLLDATFCTPHLPRAEERWISRENPGDRRVPTLYGSRANETSAGSTVPGTQHDAADEVVGCFQHGMCGGGVGE